MRSGFTKGIAAGAARQLAPRLTTLAPELTASFIRQALHRAITGVGPLPPAADAADEQLREQHGDVARGIHEVIENHVRYSLVEGFATNLGGLVTTTILAPANISGLALIQCRMVAGIAHLRGHALEDPRVRNAILVTLLGESSVDTLVKRRVLPAPPMALATAPAHDPLLDPVITQAVATDMVSRVVGKRAAWVVSKKVPLLGGVVGAGADGISTWQVGRYADREFLPRTNR
jgi:hypothetical protein